MTEVYLDPGDGNLPLNMTLPQERALPVIPTDGIQRRWINKGEPIIENSKVPKGWYSEEPDLHEEYVSE
ncbi:hypothetical protein N7448_010008 [Penicillium atrosanguineum]|uniref:Uncharacterized protein n=1 Tax=Penicillium atrosanguineum TaxID=1132637 RepID=A0A9W9PL43_9EURO|nr:NAD(P)-binding protein [Penicillium atrosanguineum]KAJ5118295.1 hypothetical protein N7526_009932 [Penicillium atrosanguineum]KAJ5119339.1 hypothetical protein N7448_010008 [Penicillium atrosanguineum]KAJ5296331.1 NAD(P)-binding protein [Penicillium atrosanguineum]KAJ5299100.1 hypothetical protein N7476_010657 [Penicillium atrosanguineum]